MELARGKGKGKGKEDDPIRSVRVLSFIALRVSRRCSAVRLHLERCFVRSILVAFCHDLPFRPKVMMKNLATSEGLSQEPRPDHPCLAAAKLRAERLTIVEGAHGAGKTGLRLHGLSPQLKCRASDSPSGRQESDDRVPEAESDAEPNAPPVRCEPAHVVISFPDSRRRLRFGSPSDNGKVAIFIEDRMHSPPELVLQLVHESLQLPVFEARVDSHGTIEQVPEWHRTWGVRFQSAEPLLWLLAQRRVVSDDLSSHRLDLADLPIAQPLAKSLTRFSGRATLRQGTSQPSTDRRNEVEPGKIPEADSDFLSGLGLERAVVADGKASAVDRHLRRAAGRVRRCEWLEGPRCCLLVQRGGLLSRAQRLAASLHSSVTLRALQRPPGRGQQGAHDQHHLQADVRRSAQLRRQPLSIACREKTLWSSCCSRS